MPTPRSEVLDFLLKRRSRPAKTLGPHAPDRAQLEALLTAASRVPDHGKLVPWRFVILGTRGAREAATAVAEKHLRAAGADDGAIDKARTQAMMGGQVVVVLTSPKPSAKIPLWEQEAASHCVCLSLVNAALASGWGANWLTGPMARHEAFVAEAFGGQPGETVAGFIHIGNEQVVPADRDRPDLETITDWR